MYDRPQISREGDWGDASIMENSKGRTIYTCRYCHQRVMSTDKNQDKIIKHLNQCETIQKILDGVLVENRDFVICKICNFHAQNVGIHLRKIHNIESSIYSKKYNCATTSKISAEKYRKEISNKFNGYHSYVEYASVNNIDLTDYKKRI